MSGGWAEDGQFDGADCFDHLYTAEDGIEGDMASSTTGHDVVSRCLMV
jgi:hypothetical protein